MRAASKSREVSKILIQPALWFCVCNLLAGALAAQCSNPTQVPNGTYTSGDHSQVDGNALSAATVALSGGASATFAAGNCIQLLPNFQANSIGATVPTTFHAWVDLAPAAVSISPSSGSGPSQSFTWTVSSPSGHSSLSHVFALFNTTSGSTANACYIHYDPTANLVYLADNASANWLGGFVPGSTGSASNSQCSINGGGASLNTSGTQLALTVPVTFHASFTGAKNEYLYALDSSGLYTGWQQFGTWAVTPPPTFTVTLQTNPSGLQLTVGSVNQTTPYAWVCGSGDTLAVAVPSPQNSSGATFVFASWSDGGAQSHTLSCPSSNAAVTANFAVQYTQTISFSSLANQTIGVAPFTITATASSGLPVSLSSQTTSVCTVLGSTVTLVAVGACTIQATQPGNANYAAATPVSQSFQVTQATQTISFGTLANQVLGTYPFAISASASSGLTVAFNSQTTSVCTISGSDVTLIAVGTCTIQATQAGNANYTAAPAVIQTFTVLTPPTLISLSPSSTTVGSAAFILHVTGTNFLNNAIVQWAPGGVPAQSLLTTFIDSAHLSAAVPASLLAAVGTAHVSVAESGIATTAAAFTVSAVPTPDFTVTVGAPVTTDAGTNATYAVTVTPSNGFTGTVGLQTSGLPTGASSVFTVNGVAQNSLSITNQQAQNATLTITTVRATTPQAGLTGVFQIAITAVSGSAGHQTSAALTVKTTPDFSLSVTPDTQTILCNGAGTFTVSTVGLNGYTGPINFQISEDTYNNGYINFSDLPMSPMAANSQVTFTVMGRGSVGCTPPLGDVWTHYTVVAYIPTAPAWPQSHDVYAKYGPGTDYTVTAQQTSGATGVTPPGSATYTVSVAGVNGYNYSTPVDLTAIGFPTGVTAVLGQTHFTADGSTSLTLTASGGTLAGNYTIRVVANNSIHAAAVPLLILGGPNSSYTLSGQVSGDATSGVTIALSGTQNATVLTDANGAYSFVVPAGGNYTLTPSYQNGYTFLVGDSSSAPPVTLTNLQSNQTQHFFAAGPFNASVSTSPSGVPFEVDGVTHTATYRARWAPNTTHTLSVNNPQSGTTGAQYIFQNWSDNGDLSHTITAAQTQNNYQATFKTQYQLTTSARGSGTVSPSGGWYDAGTTVQLTATPTSPNSFIEWDGTGTGNYSGTANDPSIAIATMNAPVTEVATFAVTMGSSTWLHSGLAYLPFSRYYDDADHLAADHGFSWPAGSRDCPGPNCVTWPSGSACPPDATVRSCIKQVLANMRAQGVSGVRVFVTFCDPDSQAFPNFCQPLTGTQQKWDPVGTPLQNDWIHNVSNFFQDVHDAGIQNVAITTFWSGGATVSADVSTVTRPSGNPCPDEPGQPFAIPPPNTDPAKWPTDYSPMAVYFNPTVPIGLQWTGDPIGSTKNQSNQGYNCAPKNDKNFLGWNNLFDVVDAILAAAAGQYLQNPLSGSAKLVTVNELEFGQQEMNLVQLPAYARYIYDNSSPETAGLVAGQTVNVLQRLQHLMRSNGFDASYVTWSAPWSDPSADFDCTDFKGGQARAISVEQIWSLIRGGPIGLPTPFPGDPNQHSNSYRLTCGGSADGMYTVPKPQDDNRIEPSIEPSIVDAHIYPQILDANNQATQIQTAAEEDYNDLVVFLNLFGLQPSQVIIGETFPGRSYPGYADDAGHMCWNYAISNTDAGVRAAADANVAGLIQSTNLGNFNVIVRPFIQISNDWCYGYGSGPGTFGNYQDLNFNWQGPYTPGKH